MKREGKSRTQPRLKSSKVGASLVEVIISFGLLTTIMFAVGAMLINQQKEVITSEVTSHFILLQYQEVPQHTLLPGGSN